MTRSWIRSTFCRLHRCSPRRSRVSTRKLRFRPCSIKILHGKELLHGCSSSFCIYFLHRPAGGHELRKRVRPFRAAAFFQHRLSGGHELPQACSPLTGGSFSAPAERGTRTALACSPLTGGEFSAEPQRGELRRLRSAGDVPRPPRGQKGRDTCGFPSSLNSYLSLA